MEWLEKAKKWLQETFRWYQKQSIEVYILINWRASFDIVRIVGEM